MKHILLFLLCPFFLLNNITCFAQWSTDTTTNNPICTEQNNQLYSRMISDGSGGAIIVWTDYRNVDSNIYAQRIDSNGVIQWSNNGIAICGAVNDQNGPEIISDGNGGAIIAWNDERNSNFYDIYAQKINSSGVIQWANDGVEICTADYQNYNPQLISDGNGGAIITWMDNRIINNGGDIYAQSVNSLGVVQWITDGVAILSNVNGHGDFPKLVSDGNNGAIITWNDDRNGEYHKAYAQRINSSGAIQWTNNGIAICTGQDHQTVSSIVSDNNGGAIISWADARGSILPPDTDYDIYSQRINSSGAIQWANNGVLICDAINSQDSPIMVPDNNGGAFITWTDYRTPANSADIYAQRVNSTGIIQWASNGIPVVQLTGRQWRPQMITNNNGFIITWDDRRQEPFTDIYAQRVDSNGVMQWPNNGVPVSTASNNQVGPCIVPNELGGGIISWYDFRNGTDYDIYTQLVNPTGTLSVEVHSNSNNSLFKVYPNPTNNSLYIEASNALTSVEVYNMLGQHIISTKPNAISEEIDMSELKSGMYLVKVKIGEQTATYKVLKQ